MLLINIFQCLVEICSLVCQKHDVPFASSVSFCEYGPLRTLTHVVSCLLLQSLKLVEDLEWLGIDLKGTAIPSQGQRVFTMENPTAISFLPTQIRCYYSVQMAFLLYRIKIVYKHQELLSDFTDCQSKLLCFQINTVPSEPQKAKQRRHLQSILCPDCFTWLWKTSIPNHNWSHTDTLIGPSGPDFHVAKVRWTTSNKESTAYTEWRT